MYSFVFTDRPVLQSWLPERALCIEMSDPHNGIGKPAKPVCNTCPLLTLFPRKIPVHLTTKLMYLMTPYYILNDGFTANNA